VGPGDDCAVVRGYGIRQLLLLKTDCVVESIHYLPEDEPQRVGWKALCRPLSDVAAMGGEPLHALVSIMSPQDRTVSYWKSFYKGLIKAAAHFGVGIVGGETSRSVRAAVSVSLVGMLRRGANHPFRRPAQRSPVCDGNSRRALRGRHLDWSPRCGGRWLGAHGCSRDDDLATVLRPIFRAQLGANAALRLTSLRCRELVVATATTRCATARTTSCCWRSPRDWPAACDAAGRKRFPQCG
jgi:thiamine-monophosphate kinase